MGFGLAARLSKRLFAGVSVILQLACHAGCAGQLWGHFSSFLMGLVRTPFLTFTGFLCLEPRFSFGQGLHLPLRLIARVLVCLPSFISYGLERANEG